MGRPCLHLNGVGLAPLEAMTRAQPQRQGRASLSPIRRDLASDLPGTECAGAQCQVKAKSPTPMGATPSEQRSAASIALSQ
jgi:hypothetical protein